MFNQQVLSRAILKENNHQAIHCIHPASLPWMICHRVVFLTLIHKLMMHHILSVMESLRTNLVSICCYQYLQYMWENKNIWFSFAYRTEVIGIFKSHFYKLYEIVEKVSWKLLIMWFKAEFESLISYLYLVLIIYIACFSEMQLNTDCMVSHIWVYVCVCVSFCIGMCR